MKDELPLVSMPKDLLQDQLETLIGLIHRRFEAVSSILITGSGSRGVINCLRCRGALVPLSDFDMVVLAQLRSVLPNIRFARKAEDEAASRIGAKVSIAVLPASLLAFAPRTNFYFELRRSRVLSGQDLRSSIRVQAVEDVDFQDGISIMFNYLHQLVSTNLGLTPEDDGGLSYAQGLYRTRSSLLGMLKGFLIYHRAYHPRRMDDGDWTVSEIERHLPLRSPSGERLHRLLHRTRRDLFDVTDLSPDGRSLAAHWDDVRFLGESLIISALRANTPAVNSSDVEVLSSYAKRPNLIGNISYLGLARASGLHMRPRIHLLRFSAKRVLHTALWHLSRAFSEDSGDEHEVRARRILGLMVGGFNGQRVTRGSLLTILSRLWRAACPVAGF